MKLLLCLVPLAAPSMCRDCFSTQDILKSIQEYSRVLKSTQDAHLDNRSIRIYFTVKLKLPATSFGHTNKQ